MAGDQFKPSLRDQEELTNWVDKFWTNVEKKDPVLVTLGYLTHGQTTVENDQNQFITKHQEILAITQSAQTVYVRNKNHFDFCEFAFISIDVALIA